MRLENFFQHLKSVAPMPLCGEIVEANGNYVQSIGPPCSVGDCCEILSRDGSRHGAEVIGFRGHNVLAMPLSSGAGIRFGDRVIGQGRRAQVTVGASMLGRVLNANGKPLDSLGNLVGESNAAPGAQCTRSHGTHPYDATVGLRRAGY